MKFKQFKRSLVLLVGFSIATLAQQPSSSTPSVDRLRQVIDYLASDALEGRRTGTPGANDAAHYIAGEFNRFGLRPGMQMARPARTRGENQARYLQPFPYVAEAQLGEGNLLSFTDGSRDPAIRLKVGEDWMPLGFSSNARIDHAQIVFAGYGISSSELKYDDYANTNAKDSVCVVIEGTPDGDNPHGQFVRAGEVRFKVAAARAAGARALVIVSREPSLREDRLFRLKYDNAGEAGIPVLIVSQKVAPAILGSRDTDVTKLDELARLRHQNAQQEQDSSVAILRFPIKGITISLTTNVIRRESPSFNVVGILPGSDPKLKDEAIVIGAHYDHLGRGGEGSLAPREGDIHHGADDNASGVAGLIELARLLSSQNPKPRRTIVFIAFSGEEEGLIGSNYYVNHPVVPLTKTVAMINMDMVGRLKEKKLIVGGVGTAQEWRELVAAQNLESQPIALAQLSNHDRTPGKVTMVMGADGRAAGAIIHAEPFSLTLNDDGYGPSDHSSFYAKQIPVLFFWTGTHADYHKPSDTADKINYEGEARIVTFVERIVREIDTNNKRPTYTVARSESQGRSTGFRVYLGTIPNYADSNDGLKLDGVRDDSPAAKAGLKAGDRIVKMAGREVKNVYDYTYALGEMKAGQEYEVEIIRDAQRLTLRITPAAKK